MRDGADRDRGAGAAEGCGPGASGGPGRAAADGDVGKPRVTKVVAIVRTVAMAKISVVARPAANRVMSTEPKMAMPMVPPIWRKNWTELVPTPRSRWGMAFCTMIEWRGIVTPPPRPRTAM